jgi:hypothetical protein
LINPHSWIQGRGLIRGARVARGRAWRGVAGGAVGRAAVELLRKLETFAGSSAEPTLLSACEGDHLCPSDPGAFR